MAGKPIVLVGGGGHARVVADILRLIGEFELVGCTDVRPDNLLSRAGIKYLGTDEILPSLRERGVLVAALGVGGFDNLRRKRLFDRLGEIGFELPAICHPTAVVAGDAALGRGTVVMAGAVINPGAVVGENVIVNTGAIIEHDCRIGDSVQIGPGAIICGGVEVGERAFIGAGACIIQEIAVGVGALVGAGALITREVPPGMRVVGNRARYGIEHDIR